jgi:uncharacterized protein (TIGR01244 family)
MRHHLFFGVLASAAVLGVVSLSAQQVKKESVEGIRNLARLETTVACAGTVTTEAVPEIKKMGFASIINLREATEPGADIEKEEAAARAAGLRFYHVPFNGTKPDPKSADQFLKAIASAGAEPAFIHCAAGNRAAAMWLIKRLVVDHWDVDRATAEADALGLTSNALRQWAIEYAQPKR